MIGSIIGDIVGSIYEFDNIKTKDFSFFQDSMDFTDDSILTFATADWIINGGNAAEYYVRYALRYPDPMGAYGSRFIKWVNDAGNGMSKPYGSCGNGSAMRVGPVGWAFDNEEDVMKMAAKSAEVTHNHPEGIKGAQATAMCIYMARKGFSKKEIRQKTEELFKYDLGYTCDDIRPSYTWGATCQDSVPQAIVCFLDACNFEDAVRNAISIGGDSDTIGCITGSIAEAYFGVPEDICNTARRYLDSELTLLLDKFESRYGSGLSR